MLGDGNKMLAYRFDGYWKDVGTIQSLWEANMNLLSENPGYEIDDADWKIFSRNPAAPPHYLGASSRVKNCYITEGCEIYGDVENSVIFRGVTVEEGAVIRDSVVFPGAYIGKNAVVTKAMIGTDAYISEDAEIGSSAENAIDDFYTKICSDDITLIGPAVFVDTEIKVATCSMVTRNIKNKSKNAKAEQKSAKGTATA